MTRFSASTALFAWLCSAGCASAGFDGRVYRDDELKFRVGQIPPTWRSIDVDGARLAFRDDGANATVALNGRCGLDGDDVPLRSLTQHLFLQFTDRVPVDQRTVSLDGRDAMRTEIGAALDGVSKRYLVYVLKKDGCVYDFMCVESIDSKRDARPEFERFVQGFATL